MPTQLATARIPTLTDLNTSEVSPEEFYALSTDETGTTPQTVYRLQDINADGDANDPGEATIVAQLPSGVVVNTIAVDANQNVWFVGNPGTDSLPGGDLYWIHDGTPALVFAGATLLSQLNLTVNAYKLDTYAGSVVFHGIEGTTPGDFLSGSVLVELRDANGDGQITIDEVQTIWSYTTGDFWSGFYDLRGLEDGSIIALGNDGYMLRLVDTNQDGDFLGEGETYVTYDNTFATNDGQTPGDQNGFFSMTASTKL